MFMAEVSLLHQIRAEGGVPARGVWWAALVCGGWAWVWAIGKLIEEEGGGFGAP